jgi:hypothetical protein
MLPMMKQMHPNLSEEQLQKMYEQCRNNGEKMMEHIIRAYEQPDATRLNCYI